MRPARGTHRVLAGKLARAIDGQRSGRIVLAPRPGARSVGAGMTFMACEGGDWRVVLIMLV